jgi:hypothetical protein
MMQLRSEVRCQILDLIDGLLIINAIGAPRWWLARRAGKSRVLWQSVRELETDHWQILAFRLDR